MGSTDARQQPQMADTVSCACWGVHREKARSLPRVIGSARVRMPRRIALAAYVDVSSKLQLISKDKSLVFLYIRLRHRHILLLNDCLAAGANYLVREVDELPSNESSRSE